MYTIENKQSTVTRDVIYQYIGSGSQPFAGLIFYIVITKVLPVASVGAIALFLTIIGFFRLLFSFGLGTSSKHFVSYYLGKQNESSVKAVINRLTFLAISFGSLGLTILLLLAPNLSISLFHTYLYTKNLRSLGLVLGVTVIFMTLDGVMIGLQKFTTSAIINVVMWCSYYLSAAILAYMYGNLNIIINGWIVGVSIGVILQLSIILPETSRILPDRRTTAPKGILAYSAPIFVSTLFVYGSNFADRFILVVMTNLSNLGVYNLSAIIAGSMSFLALPFNNIFLSKFSEWYGMGNLERIRDNFRISSLLLYSIFIPSATMIISISDIILNKFVGIAYGAGKMPLIIMLSALSIFAGQNVIMQLLTAVKKAHIFIMSSGLSLCANFALSFALIPIWGMNGAALGFFSVSAINFFILYIYSKKTNLVSFNIRALFKIGLSSVVMYAVVSGIEIIAGNNPFLLPLYITMGLFTYILGIKYMKIFSDIDRKRLLSWIGESYFLEVIVNYIMK